MSAATRQSEPRKALTAQHALFKIKIYARIRRAQAAIAKDAKFKIKFCANGALKFHIRSLNFTLLNSRLIRAFKKAAPYSKATLGSLIPTRLATTLVGKARIISLYSLAAAA